MKRHVASLAAVAITIAAAIFLTFIETSTHKVFLPPASFIVGWAIACAIFYFEELRCRRHMLFRVVPRVQRPTVCEFKWGVPLQGPQDGPPCNDCGAKTIVAHGPCASLYWCANCKKNVLPELASPAS